MRNREFMELSEDRAKELLSVLAHWCGDLSRDCTNRPLYADVLLARVSAQAALETLLAIARKQRPTGPPDWN